METKYYFDEPIQVLFADPDNLESWCCGIAYKDEIICACCGGIFEIEEIVEFASEEGIKVPIYEYEEWANLGENLVGGEYPKDFPYDLYNGKPIEFEADTPEIENEIEEDHDDVPLFKNFQ